MSLLGFVSVLAGSTGEDDVDISAVARLSGKLHLPTSVLDFWLNHAIVEVVHTSDKKKIMVFSSVIYTGIESQLPKIYKTVVEQKNSKALTKLIPKSWTLNSQDFFLKDFVFIPLCRDTHFVLAIICYPGLLGKDTTTWQSSQGFQNYGKRTAAAQVKSPFLVVLDSKHGVVDRTKIGTTLRNFLTVFWQFQHHTEITVTANNFPMVFPRIPGQDAKDKHDCGPFLLRYFEEFFSNPFTPRNLPLDKDFLFNWFDASTIHLKRQEIYDTIVGCIKETHPENMKSMPLFHL